MRISSIIYLVYFYSATNMAQDKRTTIGFEFNTHDFGSIHEDGGKVSYDFKFTNEGNFSLQIKNVVAGCGCTVSQWPKESIPPGSSGYITVIYDPLGRPGPFNKQLTVYSNAINDPFTIQISGKVTPKPRKLSDDFPDVLGKMRLQSRYLNLGEIQTNQWQRKQFDFYNDSDTTLHVYTISVFGTHMSVKIDPMHVAPKSKGKIIVDYSPKWKNDFGLVKDPVDIYTSDPFQPIKRLTVMAHILQAFDELSAEQMDKAPKFTVDKWTHDFGGIKQGEVPTAEFKISNVGESDLSILKIKAACNCTVVDWDKKVLKKNESAILKVKFDSKDKEGIQDKQLTIYTNDPKSHVAILMLKARIVK